MSLAAEKKKIRGRCDTESRNSTHNELIEVQFGEITLYQCDNTSSPWCVPDPGFAKVLALFLQKTVSDDQTCF